MCANSLAFPLMRRIFRLAVVPDCMDMLDFGTCQVFDSRATIAAFAFPLSGADVTETIRAWHPSESATVSPTCDRLAFGVTRTATVTPSSVAVTGPVGLSADMEEGQPSSSDRWTFDSTICRNISPRIRIIGEISIPPRLGMILRMGRSAGSVMR